MKVVIAMDSFKGSLSSVEAGNAAAKGVKRVFPDAECIVSPLADGGEGTVDALVAGMGGEIRTVETTSGYHIVMKYNLPEDAVTNDSYSQWFDGLDELITDRLFADRCAPLTRTVQVDEALWKETPNMADVPTNYYY